MFCSHCGKPIEENEKICPYCGSEVIAYSVRSADEQPVESVPEAVSAEVTLPASFVDTGKSQNGVPDESALRKWLSKVNGKALTENLEKASVPDQYLKVVKFGLMMITQSMTKVQ